MSLEFTQPDGRKDLASLEKIFSQFQQFHPIEHIAFQHEQSDNALHYFLTKRYLVSLFEREGLVQQDVMQFDTAHPILQWNGEGIHNIYDFDRNLQILSGVSIRATHFFIRLEDVTSEAGYISCSFSRDEEYHSIEFTRMDDTFVLAYQTNSEFIRTGQWSGIWRQDLSQLVHQPTDTLLTLYVLELPREPTAFLLSPMRQAIALHSH